MQEDMDGDEDGEDEEGNDGDKPETHVKKVQLLCAQQHALVKMPGVVPPQWASAAVAQS